MQTLVVLAEDEQDLRQALTDLLEEVGARVVSVAHVGGLRAILREVTPDLLLTDFHLSDGTVEPLLDELVAEGRVERIFVLSASPHARAAAQRLGLSFLPKPFELEDLLDAVGRAGARAA